MSKLESSPTDEIVAQVNDLGLKRAARKYNTSPATLSRWLKAQHFRLKRIYVREEQPPAPQSIQQLLQEQLEKYGLAEGAEIIMEDAP